MIEIDLVDRMYKAFGYVPSGIVDKAVLSANIQAVNTLGEKLARADNKLLLSRTKKNISQYAVVRNDKTFADLTLKNGEQVFRFANGILTENTPNILAPTPMLSFKRTKNIVKTVVDGSDSEVIECFGCKAWEIDIDGILVDLAAHSYPSEKVIELRKLFEINDILEVVDNQIMEDLNIQSIYIENIESFKIVDGFNDTMQFKIKAYSIKPIEFFI